MKKFVAIFLLCFISISIEAQYRKMPLDTNHYWQENSGHVGSYPSDFWDCYHVLRVRGDSLINGKIFKRVEGNGICSNRGTSIYSVLLREDTLRRILTFMDGQVEKILYNFNKNVGDTTYMLSYFGMDTLKVFAKDSILLNDGFYHRRFLFSSDPSDAIIEGVGGMGGLLTFWTINFESYSLLLCVGQISPPASIYSNEGLGKSCPNLTSISPLTYFKPEILLFPNPSNDRIKITSDGLTINSFDIKNILGQTILQSGRLDVKSVSIEISDFPAGIYFVIVNSDNFRTTLRLEKN